MTVRLYPTTTAHRMGKMSNCLFSPTHPTLPYLSEKVKHIFKPHSNCTLSSLFIFCWYFLSELLAAGDDKTTNREMLAADSTGFMPNREFLPLDSRCWLQQLSNCCCFGAFHSMHRGEGVEHSSSWERAIRGELRSGSRGTLVQFEKGGHWANPSAIFAVGGWANRRLRMIRPLHIVANQ